MTRRARSRRLGAALGLLGSPTRSALLLGAIALAAGGPGGASAIDPETPVAVFEGGALEAGAEELGDQETGAQKPGGIVARVGPETISAQALGQALQAKGPAPSDRDSRAEVLDELIFRRLLLQAARDDGYLEDPEVVAALEQALERRYREDWRAARAEDLAVSEEELADAWAKQRQEWRLPERRRIALLPLPEETTRKRADAIHGEALALPPAVRGFGPLAARHSTDRASRSVGGDVGWIVPGDGHRWPASVTEAAFALDRVGSVAPLLTVEGRFWLVRLLAVEPERDRAFSAVAPELERALRQERLRDLERQWRAELAGRFPVEVDEELLEALPVHESRPPSLPGVPSSPSSPSTSDEDLP